MNLTTADIERILNESFETVFRRCYGGSQAMNTTSHNFPRAQDIEGSTYDPYDAVWPEGSRVERGPLQPFTCDDHEPVGPDPLFNATVLVICGALLYTAGSGVYWLWRLAMWVAG